MDPSKTGREELPAIDMRAVVAERKAIAAKSFPNDKGNYRPKKRPAENPNARTRIIPGPFF